ncbi:MAG TPA: 2-dehydro-3-deoxyglucarate aldolase [Verrucomicrobiales bacterium]|nr:2-dehydro-3-deoxyglucarate aldolase [Verrucomicrobiales bacterium]
MKKNFVRSKLKLGQPSIGSWLTLPDPTAARLMGRIGFDWLTVEMEHTPTTLETAVNSFMAISSGGTVPLVRVPWNNGENIKRVLDIGAWGIIVPMVNSREEAEAAVAAARYRKPGRRSVGGQLHAVSFDTDAATYYAKADEEILVVVMAEHVEAIDNAESILSVPGIDAVFIGPNDLLNSMGYEPAFDSDKKEFIDAVGHIKDTAKRNGVAPGIHVANSAAAQHRIQEGFQMIAIASEVGMMLAKAKEIAAELDLKSRGEVAKY